MKAVISVIGRDKPGIIAKVSTKLFENNINILDISQTIMSEMFCMIMLIENIDSKFDFSSFSEMMQSAGDEIGVEIHIQREEIFESMHRI